MEAPYHIVPKDIYAQLLIWYLEGTEPIPAPTYCGTHVTSHYEACTESAAPRGYARDVVCEKCWDHPEFRLLLLGNT